MSVLVRVTMVLLGSGWAWLVPAAAQACSFPAPPAPYEVRPMVQAEDDVAPTAFTHVDAMVWRREGRTCELGQCTSNSCGDTGHVELFFDPPQDDRTPADDLGFRVEVLEGRLPASMQARMTQPQVLEDAMRFRLGFDEVAEVDAVITLIAIDRAGNESPASEPIRLRFSGCTKPATGRMCKKGGPLACHAASGSAGWTAWGIMWPWMTLLLLRSRRRRTH